MTQLGAGQPTGPLRDSIDLVAEVEPGRLIVRCFGGLFVGEATHDVRVARVLYSRAQAPRSSRVEIRSGPCRPSSSLRSWPTPRASCSFWARNWRRDFFGDAPFNQESMVVRANWEMVMGDVNRYWAEVSFVGADARQFGVNQG